MRTEGPSDAILMIVNYSEFTDLLFGTKTVLLGEYNDASLVLQIDFSDFLKVAFVGL